MQDQAPGGLGLERGLRGRRRSGRWLGRRSPLLLQFPTGQPVEAIAGNHGMVTRVAITPAPAEALAAVRFGQDKQGDDARGRPLKESQATVVQGILELSSR